ncbi:hypothetical protein D3C86_1377140 [compost metagenome]
MTDIGEEYLFGIRRLLCGSFSLTQLGFQLFLRGNVEVYSDRSFKLTFTINDRCAADQPPFALTVFVHYTQFISIGYAFASALHDLLCLHIIYTSHQQYTYIFTNQLFWRVTTHFGEGVIYKLHFLIPVYFNQAKIHIGNNITIFLFTFP